MTSSVWDEDHGEESERNGSMSDIVDLSPFCIHKPKYSLNVSDMEFFGHISLNMTHASCRLGKKSFAFDNLASAPVLLVEFSA